MDATKDVEIDLKDSKNGSIVKRNGTDKLTTINEHLDKNPYGDINASGKFNTDIPKTMNNRLQHKRSMSTLRDSKSNKSLLQNAKD